MKWLKHAFAVDEGTAAPTAEQQPAVDWFCRQVAKRHLTTPGLIGLEMSRPLNFIASQTMHFFSPGVWAVMPQKTYEHYLQFATFLEKRGAIEYLCRRIEHFEQQAEEQTANGIRQTAKGKTDDDP